jgi:hypothetical protein
MRLFADQRFVVEKFVVEKPTTPVVRFETNPPELGSLVNYSAVVGPES